MSGYVNEELYKLAIKEMEENPYIDYTLKYFHDKYGFDSSCFSRYLKSKGKTVKHTGKSTEKSKLYFEAAKKYIDGEPAYKVAKEYNISLKSFCLYLHEKNFSRSTVIFQKRSVDEDFFENIDTEEKAYWLGFILADGCVRDENIAIELSNVDYNHLKKFKQSLHATQDIYNRKDRETSFITIARKKMCKDLQKLGCVKSKTYNGWIDRSAIKGLEKPFLRGLLDGDGFIERKNMHKYRVVYTIKSKTIKDEVMDMLSEYRPLCLENCSNKDYPDKFVYRISIENKDGFFQFLDDIYTDASIYLDRKYYIAMARLSARPEPESSNSSGSKMRN